jgi:hypothetical protein
VSDGGAKTKTGLTPRTELCPDIDFAEVERLVVKLREARSDAEAISLITGRSILHIVECDP